MNPIPLAAKLESTENLLQIAFARLPSDQPAPTQDEQRVAEARLELARRLAKAERERAHDIALLEKEQRAQATEKRPDRDFQLTQAEHLESLGTLAGGIAHDFNNLLTGLIGFVELSLEAVQRGDPADNLLVEARGCGLRARDLVERLLLFSRRSPDTFRRPVQLEDLVAESHRLISATLPPSIQITLQLPANLPPVEVDPAQIQLVLVNLCLNAAHAIGGQPGQLVISLHPATLGSSSGLNCRAGDYVCLTVSDNGCGMDEATQARIYDPFFTTKPRGEGTGLGLAMVHGIIAGHEGGIRLRSALNVGTTFEIYLPLGAAPRGDPPPSSPALTGVRGEQRTILIADDETTVRTLVKAVLEQRGFQVEACADGEEALARFRRQPEAYDVALLDWSMPGMNGGQLLQELHAVRPTLPVVLMSGAYHRPGSATPPASVLIARLSKPFSAPELLTALTRALPAPA
jgi:signal transduction histidine kinase/ActR/RegA family two-component response regulator